MSELGEILGRSLSNQQNMQHNLIKPGSQPTQFVVTSYKLKVVSSNLLVENKSLGLTFIFGSSTNGIIGTDKFGDLTGSYSTYYEDTTQQVLPSSGRYWVRDWISNGVTSPTYVGIGSGTTAFNISDTALESEVGSRVTLSSNTGTSYNVTLIGELVPGISTVGGTTIGEVGWFSASTGGTIFSRRVFTGTVCSDLLFTRISETFTISDESVGNSLITNDGLNLTRSWIGGDTSSRPIYSEWGFGNGTIPADRDYAVVLPQDRNAVSSYTDSGFRTVVISVLDTSEPTNNLGTTLSVYLQQTGLSTGIIGGSITLLDNCSTQTFTESTDAAVQVINTSQFREGDSGLSIGKSGTASTIAYYYQTLGSTYDGTGCDLGMGLRFVDITQLASTGTAVEIRIGNDSSNYYVKSFSQVELTNYWNVIEHNLATSASIGSPNVTTLDYLYIGLHTDSTGTIIAAGSIVMDYWHLANRGTATLFCASRISPTYKTSNFKIQQNDYIEVV